MNTAIGPWARRFASGRARYGLLVGYLAVLSFLSVNPWLRPAAKHGAFSPDKIDHVVAYGGLAVLFYFCFSWQRRGKGRSDFRVWLLAMGVATLMGLLLEICQTLFTADRAGSMGDVAANGIGAVAGYGLFRLAAYLHRRGRRQEGHP